MWYFRKIDPLAPFGNRKYVSFVGGGGKTSFAEHIAALALNRGRRVLITTTTKIWAREPYATFDGTRIQEPEPGQVLRLGKSAEDRKLTGLSPEEIEKAGKDYELVLIEADGAKNMPLKYPASFEPVIPEYGDMTVVVAGLDALGCTVEERVFRSSLLAEKRGIPGDEKVTLPFFLGLFEADALLKGVETSRCLVVLNKYDACPERAKVPELARGISERTGASVVISSVRHGIFYCVDRRSPLFPRKH
jgi:probable selenium-dependent hydroxylase accessory protein YqeC